MTDYLRYNCEVHYELGKFYFHNHYRLHMDLVITFINCLRIVSYANSGHFSTYLYSHFSFYKKAIPSDNSFAIKNTRLFIAIT